MNREEESEESEELSSRLLLCDGEGNYDLENKKNRNRADREKKTREEKGRLKGKARDGDGQWKISEEEAEKG